MRPGEVVECLKQHYAPPPMGAILTETPAFANQRRQGMTQSKVETFNPTGTDRQPQLLQAPAPAAPAVDQLLHPPLARLFDSLAIDQIGGWLLHELFGASRLARAREGLQRMVDFDQTRQIKTEAIATKPGDAQDDGSRHLDQLQGTLKRPRAYKSCQNQAKLGGETDPDPLSSIFADLCALAVRADLLGMLTPDEAPHLVELHLSNRQVAQQVCVDLMGLLSGSPQPRQNGCFGHAHNKADVTKCDF